MRGERRGLDILCEERRHGAEHAKVERFVDSGSWLGHELDTTGQLVSRRIQSSLDVSQRIVVNTRRRM